MCQFLERILVKQPENLCMYMKKAAGEEPGNEAMLYQTLSLWVGSLVPRLHCRTALLYLSDKTLTDSTEVTIKLTFEPATRIIPTP